MYIYMIQSLAQIEFNLNIDFDLWFVFEKLQDLKDISSLAEQKSIELLHETLVKLDAIMQNGYSAARANISFLQ